MTPTLEGHPTATEREKGIDLASESGGDRTVHGFQIACECGHQWVETYEPSQTLARYETDCPNCGERILFVPPAPQEES